jgi:adhesin HecA-like repeat protein
MNSVLITRYGSGTIITMTLNGSGDPSVGTLQNVITGLGGAEGAFIDPITGDFLFSTFGGGNQVIRVSGFLAPTAASVSIAGRVANQQGTGVSGARVSLTDLKGQTRMALTNGFGYYSFQDVMVGETYLVSVLSKRFAFAPRTIIVRDELTGLDFTPEP